MLRKQKDEDEKTMRIHVNFLFNARCLGATKILDDSPA